ncbi:hypothetical protein GUJ93_ZPchr0006g45965 [Zizania palustris]|uniref:Uncharacterized protein n=1 Tax=Zizania palustris TaxID=103762 RepID=A0A8J5SDB0_ZIZPA|nr:hypothetical protein GUJ93_ZPchr0006g45965 [Zizania palustris]
MASANGDGNGHLFEALDVARVYCAKWIFPSTAPPPVSSVPAVVVHTKPNDRAVVRPHFPPVPAREKNSRKTKILEEKEVSLCPTDKKEAIDLSWYRFSCPSNLHVGEPESRGIGYRSQKPRDETEEKAVLWPSLHAPVRLILRLPNDGCTAAVSSARRISGAPWFSGLLLLLIEERKRFPGRRNSGICCAPSLWSRSKRRLE